MILWWLCAVYCGLGFVFIVFGVGYDCWVVWLMWLCCLTIWVYNFDFMLDRLVVLFEFEIVVVWEFVAWVLVVLVIVVYRNLLVWIVVGWRIGCFELD